jgi:hypothetical protein
MGIPIISAAGDFQAGLVEVRELSRPQVADIFLLSSLRMAQTQVLHRKPYPYGRNAHGFFHASDTGLAATRPIQYEHGGTNRDTCSPCARRGKQK